MKRLLGQIWIVLVVSVAVAAGGSVRAEEEGVKHKDVTLDYIYKKDDLGVKPVNPSLPHSLQWSPKGHTLAYLVSYATEAPHLVFYDPVKDATSFLLTPFALHDALIELASKPEGVPLAHMSKPCRIPDDVTDIARIDHYKWMKEENRVRLTIDGKSYLWGLEPNCLVEEKKEKHDLPAGEKNDLEYSPNERHAAYTRENDIYFFDTEQGKETRLTHDGSVSILNGIMTWVYWEELHYRRGYRAFYWPPTNDALAYLQFDENGVSTYPVTDFSTPVPNTRNMYYPKAGTRNPTVRVGVVSLSTRQTRWIDLGEPYEYIARVEWHPDGKTLAIQTLNRAQTQLRLLFADPILGTSHIVLEENDEKWVNANGGPYFLENGDFLWLSERSGYRHLYRYSKDGKKVKALTQGDWEVNPSLWQVGVEIDEEDKKVYFNANQSSPMEKQYYSVSLNGGKMTQLTNEAGSHDLTLSADKRFALDRFNNIDAPDRIQVIDNRGRHVSTLGETVPEDYAPYRFKSTELLELEGPDGLKFYATMLKPFDFVPTRKYPVIFHVYGGPAAQVARNGYTSAQDMAFVNRGFILFKFDTRGTPGRGREWIDAIYRNGIDKPLADLKFAVEYLKTLPYIDGDHIGVWGWSNGGYMTCSAMIKTPGVFKAGAAVAPLVTYELYDTIYAERYMGTPENNPDGYKESDPANFAERLKDKLLIAHGVSDDNVHIQNVYHLVDALIEADKDYELYVYPQRDHGIGGDDRRYHLFERILSFFEKELKQF